MLGHVPALNSYRGGRVVDLWEVLCSPITVFASRWPLVLRIKPRLRSFLEFLEPSRQAVSIRPIHTSPR
jgi:hypothetical protein